MLLFPAIASSILILDDVKELARWDVVVRQLTSEPKEFRHYLQTKGKDDRRTKRWFVRVGVLKPQDDEMQSDNTFAYERCPVRVEGLPDAWVGLLGSYADGPLVLFQFDGGKLSGSIVRSLGQGSLMPESAVAVDGRLYVAGTKFWFGNAPQVAIKVFGKKDGGWQEIAGSESPYEAVEIGKLRLRPGRRAPEPMLAVSRTYPDSLDVCHATAQEAHREMWVFDQDSVHRVADRKLETPFNVLNDLSYEIETGDWSGVMANCSTRKVARELWRLRPKYRSGPATVEFVDHVCHPNARVLALANLGVWLHFVHQEGRWKVGRLSPYKPDDQGA